MGSGDLLTVDDAAIEFDVHRATLFRAIREGSLRRHRLMGDKRTYVDRWEVQRMIDPPTVKRCLSLVFDEFRRTGEWPKVDPLQRRLARAEDDFDLTAAMEMLPRELGWRVRDHEGRAELTLRGMARCEGSGPEVAAYVTAVRAAYTLYLSDTEDLNLTSTALTEEHGYDVLMLEKLYRLLQIESGWWQMLGKNGDEWTVTVSDRIRFFRDVESISDYFAAKQRMFGVPVSRPPARYSVYPSAGQDHELASHLHPVIADAADRLLASGDATAAILAACAAFERLVQESLHDDKAYGARAASMLFDRAAQSGIGDIRRMEGLRAIAAGAMNAYRNQVAHGRMQFALDQAGEIVALFSLLSREIDILSVGTIVEGADP